MKGLFITFEGTEGSGKSTQVQLLAERLRGLGQPVRVLREPGGTPIGEEIRHTLKHSQQNQAMTPETELLLMSASRAQLVREMIQPALEGGELVLCDRFYDSTLAYQGYGRQLDLTFVKQTILFAIGIARPDLTLLLRVPVDVSEARRQTRWRPEVDAVSETAASPGTAGRMLFDAPRDRMEEADRAFFERVERGYDVIAAEEPDRVHRIDATRPVAEVQTMVWEQVQRLLAERGRPLAAPLRGEE